MPIEPHIENLQLSHPEEPLEIIRLACYLGDNIAIRLDIENLQ